MVTRPSVPQASAGRTKGEKAVALRTVRMLLCSAVVAAVLAVGTAVYGQDPSLPPSLRTVPVPEPSQLHEIVADKQLAIMLGKAFFWDMQVGSDGVQACASCHFHAGADSRAKNQLSPGLLRVHPNLTPNPDTTFALGVNVTLARYDFPLTRLNNPQDRTSGIARAINDVVSSQGVFFAIYKDVSGTPMDDQQFAPDPEGFQVHGVNVRRVEPRHTPSMINAVFNHRNFWDGRAQPDFNGVNHLGAKDTEAHVYRAEQTDTLARVRLLLDNASLASQAVAPIVNHFEMSAQGRTTAEVGQKLTQPEQDSTGLLSQVLTPITHILEPLPLLGHTVAEISQKLAQPLRQHSKTLQTLRPLAQQQVHTHDSVLGPYSRTPMPGLTFATYTQLIQAAFRHEWWSSNRLVAVAPDGTTRVVAHAGDDPAMEYYTLLEYNFPLFFGLAVQLYEATLVADDTPFDRWRRGEGNISDAAQKGADLFRSQSRGRCINCHGGPELTEAAVTTVFDQTKGLTRIREGNLLDRGFNNIGLRPSTDDPGVGGRDLLGNTLSIAHETTLPSGLTFGVDGAFKTPGLRNVELTAPYFHHGGYLTLREVIDFYSRGGDFFPITSFSGTIISPLSVPQFTQEEQDQLLAFLLTLTDERVRYQRAPFDHPQIFIPNGHPVNHTLVINDGTGKALDTLLEIPAVGAAGGAPLPLFLRVPQD